MEPVGLAAAVTAADEVEATALAWDVDVATTAVDTGDAAAALVVLATLAVLAALAVVGGAAVGIADWVAEPDAATDAGA